MDEGRSKGWAKWALGTKAATGAVYRGLSTRRLRLRSVLGPFAGAPPAGAGVACGAGVAFASGAGELSAALRDRKSVV